MGQNEIMKTLNFGIIAHVDSGKTTLSEGILYQAGTIRRFGRVDKGESFLDGGEIERRRGITITSKQARFTYGDTTFTLLDTPGHSDFSAEMERTLQVMDYCVLLISASDGIRGQTETLWKLLRTYEIPTYIFFNKMDQPGADAQGLMLDVRALLSDTIVDFSKEGSEEFYDQIAMCSEEAMEEFLETGSISEAFIADMIADKRLTPAFFGSALNIDGVDGLLSAMDRYSLVPDYSDVFGARVYKIMRDGNSRLSLMKITGGKLATRDTIEVGAESYKVTQIRLYNGEKYTTTSEVHAGDICAVEGLLGTYAGQGLGSEAGTVIPVLMPVLSYRVIFEKGVDTARVLPDFRTLEEENPELSVKWDEEHSDIYVCVMGEVQLEILTETVESRLGLKIAFDIGRIMYAETIARPTVGVGHFEPLRHYAEVHLLMEPLPLGSGLEFDTNVSTDMLARNWQRLILTHLCEKEHRGVLVGAPITDMKITVIAGKAHLKHTEGGDFRQATYRAVRQGLMMTESILLEPYYRFTMEIPAECVGRAMTDLGNMKAEFDAPIMDEAGEFSVITGRVPVSSFAEYPKICAAYTQGRGHVSINPDGYGECINSEEVIAARGYDPTMDMRNTPDSVFCAHGSGVIVPYSEVYEHKHVPFASDIVEEEGDGLHILQSDNRKPKTNSEEIWLGIDEIDAIISGISRSRATTKVKKPGWKRKSKSDGGAVTRTYGSKSSDKGKARVFEAVAADYMLVDGYNVIFAWEDLNELAQVNIDSARDKLLDILCNYQGMIGCELIVVFDAYRVKGHDTEYSDFHNIHVVYTAEAETADQYIERFAHENGRKYKVTVVTSDGLEQIIIRGENCALISSREFKTHIEQTKDSFNNTHGVS